MAGLAMYRPGNVRELRNLALRYALEPNTSVAKILAGYQAQDDIDTLIPLPLSVKVQEFERSLIEASIRQQKGNIQGVLEQLQLPRKTLNQKRQKYGLNRTDYLNEIKIHNLKKINENHLHLKKKTSLMITIID